MQDLIRCLRYGGYLDAKKILGGDQFEILEQLMEQLSGGSGKARLYYIVDRRDFLEKVKSVYARYATGRFPPFAEPDVAKMYWARHLLWYVLASFR